MGVNCSSNQTPEYMIHNIKDTLSYKIILLGDSGTGKTAVFNKYVDHTFNPQTKTTTKPTYRTVTQKVNVPDDYVVSVTLWDLPIAEELDLRHSYYRNVDAVIVVSDVCDDSTIRLAGTWRQDFVNKASRTCTVTEVLPNGHTTTTVEKQAFDPYSVPFLLLGNKYDQIEDEVKAERLRKEIQNNILDQSDLDALTNTDTDPDLEIPVDNVVGTKVNPQDVENEELEKPACLIKMEDVENKHDFIGSMLVSAKLSDGSIDLAFQSLIRYMLDKSRPAKMKPVQSMADNDTGTARKKRKKAGKKETYITYCGFSGLDDKFRACYTPVKRADDLHNYYGILHTRLRQMCLDRGFLRDTQANLQDCIIALNQALQNTCHINLKVESRGDFIELCYGEETDRDVPDEILHTVAFFNNEFAALCQIIQNDCNKLEPILTKLELSLKRMADQLTNKYKTQAEGYVEICHKNQARVAFARKQAAQNIDNVDSVKRQVQAALIW